MPRPKVLLLVVGVGVPKENPAPPAEVLAGVPKLKVPVGLVLGWVVVVLKLKPPPGAAELVTAKPVLGAVAVAF